LTVINRLGFACFRRDPDSWRISFDYLASRIADAKDLPRAKQLEREGKKAVQQGDTAKLRSVVDQLRELMPADPVTRRMSYDSGVQ
jgi:hypothetical protein